MGVLACCLSSESDALLWLFRQQSQSMRGVVGVNSALEQFSSQRSISIPYCGSKQASSHSAFGRPSEFYDAPRTRNSTANQNAAPIIPRPKRIVPRMPKT